MDSRNEDRRIWTRSVWVRIGASGGFMWTEKETFGLDGMNIISWVADCSLALQKALISCNYINILTHSRNTIFFFEKYSWNNFILHTKNTLWLWRTACFWVVTQLIVVIPYRRFGTTCRVPSSRVKNPPETSVRNYHYSLRNNPEERSSHLLRGRNLKSRMMIVIDFARLWRYVEMWLRRLAQ